MDVSEDREAPAPVAELHRRRGPRRGIEARANPDDRRTGADRRAVPGWLALFVDVFRREGEQA